jgi:hypothetical protein
MELLEVDASSGRYLAIVEVLIDVTQRTLVLM